METSDALKACKFYKGEDECPYELDDITSTFWSIEQGWIKLCTGKGSELRANNYAGEFITDFPDMLQGINIPLDLKAAMHNRYVHFNGGSKDGFLEFIMAYVNAKD